MLSHGTGGAALHLEWLARDLARRGFIAVGVNHHGDTIAEPYRAEGFLCWWERARDLTVLLDDILARGEFAERVDADRIFVVGYSLGGCTAAALLGAITQTSRFQKSPANQDRPRPERISDLGIICRACWRTVRLSVNPGPGCRTPIGIHDSRRRCCWPPAGPCTDSKKNASRRSKHPRESWSADRTS